MKSFAISTSLLAALATSVNSQVIYNLTTHTLQCLRIGHAFCGSPSASTNIIIRCYGKRAVPGNCGDNLAGVSPVGVKVSALCYESNPMAGNAACSYGGVVYPDSGSPFPIPPLGPQFIHNTTNGSATTSTMTMSMILSAPVKVTTLLTMPGLSLPTGIATLYPNIGGYGNSSITGTGTPAPTQPSLPPNPSATFIGGTARLTVNLGLLTGLLMVFGLILFA